MAPTSSRSGQRQIRSSVFDLYMTPDKVFASLSDEPYSAFLDSAISQSGPGLYSYIAFRPNMVIRSRGRHIDLIKSGQTIRTMGDPFEALQDALNAHRIRRPAGHQGMIGGFIGYLSYELGGHIERLPLTRKDDLRIPEMYFAFYDTIFSYNHLSAQWQVTSFSPDGPSAKHRELLEELMLHAARQEAAERENGSAVKKEKSAAPVEIKSNFTRKQYLQAVRKAKRYIRDGDIYQVNISQRFTAPLTTKPWDLYRKLRHLNPAPYACYLKFPEVIIASSSPELFLQVTGRDVETHPIKGTRPRGRNKTEDQNLKTELAHSKKDRAELSMIVDLERNDLGKVCETGSVVVRDHLRIEEYATVFHTVSTVAGKLRRDKDLTDLLRATFPGGSITGCPKIRSMEIIDELEPTVRGPYTGSIGYLSADGDVDLNIAIRTFIIKGKKVTFQVGGGIVNDSDPAEEYKETLAKGKALLQALLEVEETQDQ